MRCALPCGTNDEAAPSGHTQLPHHLAVTSCLPPPGGAQAAQSTVPSTSFQNSPFLRLKE